MLQILFERSLRTGGFPAAVVDEQTYGGVSDGTVGLLRSLVEREIQRHRLAPDPASREG